MRPGERIGTLHGTATGHHCGHDCDQQDAADCHEVLFFHDRLLRLETEVNVSALTFHGRGH